MQDFKVDFIGIGSWKCGTTWLFNVLKQHPEICGPKRKEVRYFNKYRMNGRINFNFDKSLDFYRSFWPKKIPEGCKLGEFSPTYLPDKFALKRIKKTFPDAKFIVMLRNPVDKAFSLFRSRKNFATDIPKNISFEEMIERYPEFIEDCKYYPQLKRWYDLFNKKQIGVFLLEEVKKDKDKFIKSVFYFLEVDDSFKPKEVEKKNVTPNVEYTFFRTLLSYVLNLPIYIYRLIERSFSKNITEKIYKSKMTKKFSRTRRRILFSFRSNKKPKINIETRKKLMDYFLDDIKKVEKLTGKDLSIWKNKK